MIGSWWAVLRGKVVGWNWCGVAFSHLEDCRAMYGRLGHLWVRLVHQTNISK